MVESSGLRNGSVLSVIFTAFFAPYLKQVLPESFGIGYNRGITLVRAVFFLTVGHLSECVVICPSCGGEILSDNKMRRTPRGKVVCDECAQDTYVDVPLA